MMGPHSAAGTSALRPEKEVKNRGERTELNETVSRTPLGSHYVCSCNCCSCNCCCCCSCSKLLLQLLLAPEGYGLMLLRGLYLSLVC